MIKKKKAEGVLAEYVHALDPKKLARTRIGMQREAFINRKSEEWKQYRKECGFKDPVVLDEIQEAFYEGMLCADAHPHWISVEDGLPPRWETNPNISDTVITYGFLGDTHPIVELNHYHFGDKRWFYSQATHWMPFEHPKKGD